MDAPYTGGTAPGGRIFAVNGNFTIASPCGAPEIYFPFGDSTPDPFSIVILDRSINPPAYSVLPVGTGFNVQDFTSSQATMVIEQEFMVAMAYYAPMPLNTLYDASWSVGWGLNGLQVSVTDCFLVEEGPLIPVGGGIVRFKRKFVNLPPNRNEKESYNCIFPTANFGNLETRPGYSRIKNSRVFHEFFVYDNFDLLGFIPLFPAGHRLTTSVIGADSQFMNLEETKFFKATADAVINNNILGSDEAIVDGPPSTTPSWSTYKSWIGNTEIIAEASSFNRWMGNIFVRRTRFVLAE